MNFEWNFSQKTGWKNYGKNKIFRSIVFITQTTIVFSLIITILTFSIGFGFQKMIEDKLFNIRGQIFVKKKNFIKNVPLNFSMKNKNAFSKKFFYLNYIKKIYGIAENNVIIRTNNKIDRYIYKGLYKDYNPLFFQNFLVKGNILNIKKNFSFNTNVILSEKISSSLGLDIGSNVKIDFLFFRNKETPTIISKKFKVFGLYETGIPEFDDIYIIGNIKSIQEIYKCTEDLSEGLEIFVYSCFVKDNIKKKF
ncbi:ABC transporter permease family protein [Blattabacterium cuenoti]|uniref:hypothetical protein n=1 Tax=Blattabacterium cuenoti TaxID=1653831 RepID=UPI001EEB63C8|nr:hypothetical protein [Blattabacterium cuenoti]